MERAAANGIGVLLALLAAPLQAELGLAEGTCRAHEDRPSLIVAVEGLKDRTGHLILEAYPANDGDFLAPDTELVAAAKTFRRVDVSAAKSGSMTMCIRVPTAGTYAVSLLHDRDGNRRFNWQVDGVGFAGNPKLGWKKPKAASAQATAGSRPTPITIVLNYRQGLSMRPLSKPN